MDEVLFIVGDSDPVLADYAHHARAAGPNVMVVASPRVLGKVAKGTEVHSVDSLSVADFVANSCSQRVTGVVVFLDRASRERRRMILEWTAAVAGKSEVRCICLINSFRVHFGNHRAARAEAEALRRLQGLPCRQVVLRP